MGDVEGHELGEDVGEVGELEDLVVGEEKGLEVLQAGLDVDGLDLVVPHVELFQGTQALHELHLLQVIPRQVHLQDLRAVLEHLGIHRTQLVIGHQQLFQLRGQGDVIQALYQIIAQIQPHQFLGIYPLQLADPVAAQVQVLDPHQPSQPLDLFYSIAHQVHHPQVLVLLQPSHPLDHVMLEVEVLELKQSGETSDGGEVIEAQVEGLEGGEVGDVLDPGEMADAEVQGIPCQSPLHLCLCHPLIDLDVLFHFSVVIID